MKKRIYHLIFLLVMGLFIACSGHSPGVDPPVDPPVTPDPPEVPNDPKVLYNGIRLPDQWPPTQSSSSDLEKGMSPYYLSSKPEVIDISVGRQLFVDNFLIETTSLQRRFYYPEYYAGNPVLTPDKEWEKSGTNGAAFAAPFSDGIWYDERDGKFKMWYMAGGGEYAVNGTGVTCYAESTDGINWTKPALSIIPGTNVVDSKSERDASVVWLDKQETNDSKRYKMFLVAREDGKWRYHYKTSSDGKTWRANAQSDWKSVV